MIYGAIILVVIGAISLNHPKVSTYVSITSVILIALLGQWWAAIIACLVLFYGKKLFLLISMPIPLLIAWLIYKLNLKSKTLITVLLFFANTFSLLVMVLTNVGIFYSFMSGATEQTIIPLTVAAYGLGSALWGNFTYGKTRNLGENSMENIATFANFSLFTLSVITVMTQAPFVYVVEIYKILTLVYLLIMGVRLYLGIKKIDSEMTSQL